VAYFALPDFKAGATSFFVPTILLQFWLLETLRSVASLFQILSKSWGSHRAHIVVARKECSVRLVV
jgi:hypothetical protein